MKKLLKYFCFSFLIILFSLLFLSNNEISAENKIITFKNVNQFKTELKHQIDNLSSNIKKAEKLIEKTNVFKDKILEKHQIEYNHAFIESSKINKLKLTILDCKKEIILERENANLINKDKIALQDEFEIEKANKIIFNVININNKLENEIIEFEKNKVIGTKISIPIIIVSSFVVLIAILLPVIVIFVSKKIQQKGKRKLANNLNHDL